MDLQHRTLVTSEDIYEDLCNKIEKLEYMPGQGISENELCKLYNVSRHMVRGAFNKLKQRRLIEVYPQRGTFVSLIDMEYISYILYLRESIEQEALQRVIELEDVTSLCIRMEACIKLQRDSIKKDGYNDEFYALDAEFHKSFLKEIGKVEVLNLVSDHYIHIHRWRNLEIRSLERMNQLIIEHENIVKAIRCKNLVEVRNAMHIHLDTVGRYGQSFEEGEKKYFLL